MKKRLFVLLILFPTVAFTLFDHNAEPEGWVGYEQQFGALDGRFITYGGGTLGVSIYGFSFGVGVYGDFGHTLEPPAVPITTGFTTIYGGALIGYRSPLLVFVRLRFNLLLGYGTVDFSDAKTGHFVTSPTFYVDFQIFSNLYLSVGMTYRYFHNEDRIGINSAHNGFAALLAFSWMSD